MKDQAYLPNKSGLIRLAAAVPGPVLQRKCACEGNTESDEETTGMLQRSALDGQRLGSIPPLIGEVLHSPGQPLDLSTRALMEPRFGHDFSQVRIHTDAQAAESARVVNALAYTVGRDIVFSAGQHAPTTTEGQKLIAHELTHVMQQSYQTPLIQSAFMLSEPGDAREQEADRAATQDTFQYHAPFIKTGGTNPRIQRQPAGKGGSAPQAAAPFAKPGAFDAEDPKLRAQRLAVIGGARNGVRRLSAGLSGGYLWPFETPTATGIDLAPLYGQPAPETTAHRLGRLRRFLNDLTRMVSELESAPTPAGWLTPNQATFPGGGSIGITGFSQPYQDTAMFYAHRSVALGLDKDDIFNNTFYLDTDPIPTRKTKPVAMMSGVQLGIYIVVPDPDKEPLVYRPLTKHEVWNAKGEIIEVWKDDQGYYYPNKGKKHYLPGRPSPVGY